jgi:uncharacterized membrane protein
MKSGYLPVFILLTLPLCSGFDFPKVYYIGDCLPTDSPIELMQDDPALDVVAVPATAGWFTQEQIDRSLRLYLPRTYQELLSGDLILLSDVVSTTVSSKWLTWFSRSVTVDGLGLMMIGGAYSFGAISSLPSWGITSVGAILPVESLPGEALTASWRPVVTSPEDPLMTAFPWGRCPRFHGYNKVTAREGSKLLARIDTADKDPFMVFWGIGSGRSFAFCTDWTPAWGTNFEQWEYYADFAVFSAYYTIGMEVPQDRAMLRLIRVELVNYRIRKDLMLSLIAFVEAFGANVVRLENRIRDVDLVRKRAGEHYVEQDYESCFAELQQAISMLEEVQRDTSDLKRTTLMWIWLVQWLVVTATLMISGFFLWSVMIRRRLYREMETTRLRSRDF